MPDYARYRREKKITNNEMIACLRREFPKFQKATMAMVNDPDGYAVQLTQDAEAVLVKTYGKGKGLAYYKRSRSDKRKKGNRLSVRLDDSAYARLQTLMSKMNFATVQDFLEAAILQMINRYGGAA